MFQGKKHKSHNRIDSLIGHDATVNGNIEFAGGLRIDGRVRGDVVAAEGKPSTLVLSERAKIEGAIKVSHLILNGEVTGPIYAGKYLELQPKSKVQGDVHYRTIEIHPGAVVEGRLILVEPDVAKADVQGKPSQG